MVHVYAPATILTFTCAALVNKNVSDVPLVIAFVLALGALKIPARAGRRRLVGLCLLFPVAASLLLEVSTWVTTAPSPHPSSTQAQKQVQQSSWYVKYVYDYTSNILFLLVM
jgi:hypothetical protein